MLRGERKISESSKKRFCEKLGVLGDHFEIYIEPSSLTKTGDEVQISYEELRADQFSLIADWYNYAILELAQLKTFKPDPNWIGRSLGITVSEVHAARERLQRLGLLEISDGCWETKSNNTNVSTDIQSAAHKKLQTQVLEGALKAVEEVPVTQRDQSSMTMAINKNRLSEAIEKITKFRRELCAFLQQEDEMTDVYQLSISLYPLTKQDKLQ